MHPSNEGRQGSMVEPAVTENMNLGNIQTDESDSAPTMAGKRPNCIYTKEYLLSFRCIAGDVGEIKGLHLTTREETGEQSVRHIGGVSNRVKDVSASPMYLDGPFARPIYPPINFCPPMFDEFRGMYVGSPTRGGPQWCMYGRPPPSSPVSSPSRAQRPPPGFEDQGRRTGESRTPSAAQIAAVASAAIDAAKKREAQASLNSRPLDPKAPAFRPSPAATRVSIDDLRNVQANMVQLVKEAGSEGIRLSELSALYSNKFNTVLDHNVLCFPDLRSLVESAHPALSLETVESEDSDCGESRRMSRELKKALSLPLSDSKHFVKYEGPLVRPDHRFFQNLLIGLVADCTGYLTGGEKSCGGISLTKIPNEWRRKFGGLFDLKAFQSHCGVPTLQSLLEGMTELEIITTAQDVRVAVVPGTVVPQVPTVPAESPRNDLSMRALGGMSPIWNQRGPPPPPPPRDPPPFGGLSPSGLSPGWGGGSPRRTMKPPPPATPPPPPPPPDGLSMGLSPLHRPPASCMSGSDSLGRFRKEGSLDPHVDESMMFKMGSPSPAQRRANGKFGVRSQTVSSMATPGESSSVMSPDSSGAPPPLEEGMARLTRNDLQMMLFDLISAGCELQANRWEKGGDLIELEEEEEQSKLQSLRRKKGETEGESSDDGGDESSALGILEMRRRKKKEKKDKRRRLLTKLRVLESRSSLTDGGDIDSHVGSNVAIQGSNQGDGKSVGSSSSDGGSSAGENCGPSNFEEGKPTVSILSRLSPEELKNRRREYRNSAVGMLVSSIKTEWTKVHGESHPLNVFMSLFLIKKLKQLLLEVPNLVITGSGGFMRVTTVEHAKRFCDPYPPQGVGVDGRSPTTSTITGAISTRQGGSVMSNDGRSPIIRGGMTSEWSSRNGYPAGIGRGVQRMDDSREKPNLAEAVRALRQGIAQQAAAWSALMAMGFSTSELAGFSPSGAPTPAPTPTHEQWNTPLGGGGVRQFDMAQRWDTVQKADGTTPTAVLMPFLSEGGIPPQSPSNIRNLEGSPDTARSDIPLGMVRKGSNTSVEVPPSSGQV